MTIAPAFGQNGTGVELAGDWKTSLEVSGTTLRLILHVASASGAGSGLSATLDSLDQGALGLKVDAIRMEGPRLFLEMSQFGARYEGDWNTRANRFEGKWEQGSAAFPLNWKRAPRLANAIQTLSDEDRKYLLVYLKKTGDGVVQSITRLSQAQWTYKPDSSRWSAAECVEHLAIEERTLFAAITGQVVKIPIPEGQARAAREQDERIVEYMLDREKKVNAGEAVRPHGKLATPAEGHGGVLKGQRGIDRLGARDAVGLARLRNGQPHLQEPGCVSVFHPDGGALGAAHGADRRSFEFGETVAC